MLQIYIFRNANESLFILTVSFWNILDDTINEIYKQKKKSLKFTWLKSQVDATLMVFYPSVNHGQYVYGLRPLGPVTWASGKKAKQSKKNTEVSTG